MYSSVKALAELIMVLKYSLTAYMLHTIYFSIYKKKKIEKHF